MYTNCGIVVKEFVFKNEREDLKVVMVEELIHKCYKPDIERFLVSLVNFKSGQIKQRYFRNYVDAIYATETYCVEAEEIMVGVAETDLWNEMEAEDLAEAKRIQGLQ